jgi:Flp pilus assembly protein TadB
VTPLSAVAGLLLVGGVLALLLGARPTPARPTFSARRFSVGGRWGRLTRRPAGARGRRRDLLLGAGLLAGLAIATVSGWLIAIAVVPAVLLGLPPLLRVPKPRDVEVLEALDRWVRSLSATLGTGKSVTDAIRISRRTAPPLLTEEIEVLVARLNNRWETREALMRMADELDSPDADAVLAALILAANRGADGASVTLQALADSIQAILRGRRAIEVERSKPYVVVRQVTVISLVTLVVAFLASPRFFDPYRTPFGQVVLAVLVLAYAGSLVLMRRKARQPARPRVLVRADR